MAAESAIRGYLAQVRRHQVLLHLLGTACALTVVCGAAVLAALLVAPAVSRVVNVQVALAGAIAAALISILGRLWLSLRRLRHDGAMSLVVGRTHPRLRSDLLSTVELTEQPGHPFSVSLVAALSERTWRRLRSRRPRDVIRLRPLRPIAAALAATAVAWAAAASFGPERMTQAARVLVGRLPSRPGLANERLVRDLNLHYRYPPYMKREERVVSGSTGHISAPPGTQVTISAATSSDAVSARLVFRKTPDASPAPTNLEVKRRHRIRGTLTVRDQGSYHFEVNTLGGRLLRDPVDHRIDIEPDVRPRIALQGPPDHLEVNALQQLDLAFAANDDWGLSRVDLVYRKDAAAPQRLALWKAKVPNRQRHANGRHRWDLAELELDSEAGGKLIYWLEAFDNDAVLGPKLGRSIRKHLTLFSAVERNDRTLARQRQLLEEALQLLAQRLVLPVRAEQRGPKVSDDAFSELYGRQDRLVDSSANLLRTMREDRLVPRLAIEQVTAMLKRLRELLKHERRLTGQLQPANRRSSKKARQHATLLRHNQQTITEMERDALLLANLLDEQRLQTLSRIAQQLKQTRRRLHDLLDQYEQNRDPQVKKRLLREMERMERRLGELSRQIARLRTTIPDEYLNQDAIEQLGLAHALNSMRAHLHKGRLDAARAALAALERKLDRMDQMLAQNLDEYRAERMPARERAYSALLDRLHELESEQRALAKRTAGLIRRYRRRAGELMRTDVDPRLDQLQGMLSKLQKRIREADSRRLESYHRERLRQLRQWAKWIGDGLQQRDMDKALKMTSQVREGLQQLVEELREDALGMYLPWRRRQMRSARQLQGARATAQRLQRALEELLPRPAQLMQPAERNDLRRMRRRQQALHKRLRSLLKPPSKRTGSTPPLLGSKQRAGLGRSGALMKEASRGLGRLRPQQAHSAQHEAAEQIAQARQSLRRAREPGQLRQGRSRRSPVKIPGADTFTPPKAFREEILEAMKEQPPETYRPQVGRYYRELVR